MSLDFTVVPAFLGTIAIGGLWTIVITLLSAAISLAGGIGFALILLYGHPLIRLPVRFVVFLFMGTPLLLQLFMIYYGLSQLGVNLPAFWTGVAGLGLHYAVYNADIIKATIRNVDVGQSEAARTLGFGRIATLRYFVVPQALLNAVPQLGNNMIILLKDSALLSVLGITELVLASQLAISRTFRPFEFYITAAAFYYVINLAMEFALRWVAAKTEEIR
ncbi:amino acid ABC transporter permease [Shinella sp. BYT-45]|uniref:amino acid ABC transporter permease n=1 Tax=Shinella sp. BYT-45 TaxID=3377377 RepID=UPI00397EF68F